MKNTDKTKEQLIAEIEQLEISEAKFRSIFENMVFGCCFDEMIYKDGIAVDYRILDVNQAYEDILGISRNDVVGKLASEVYESKDIPFFDIYTRVAETGNSETYDSFFPPANKFLRLTTICPEKGKFSNIFSDITERINSEKNLEKLKKLHSETEKSAKIGGWTFDVNTLEQTWTDEIFRILEYDFSQGAPKVPEGLEFIDPPYRQMASEAIQKAIEKSEHYNQEWMVTTLKGNKRWVRSIGNSHQENGKTISISGSFQDITEIKIAQQQIRESNDLLKNAIDYAAIGMCMVKIDGFFADVNIALCEMLGYTSEELLKMKFQDITHPDDYEIGTDAVKAMLSNELGRVVFEKRYLHKNGQIINASVSSSVLRDENGDPTYFFTQLKDITARKLAQEELQESEAKLKALINNLEAGVVVHAPDSSIIKNNSRAAELLGLTDDQLKGKSAYDPDWKFIYENNQPIEVQDYPVNQIIRNKKPIRNMILGIVRPVTKDEVWIYLNGVFVLDENENIKEIMISFIDISELKQVEKELKKIEWLLEKEKKDSSEIAENYIPDYGDVTKLNTERTILDNVGAVTLKTLCSDIMDLLDTSIAVYEKNGDYAYGQFDSRWCQTMDIASFRLCNTQDSKEALNCGKWLCHENCWNDSAKEAIITQKTTDIECIGGIHLYGVPIFAGGEIIGVINMGYGNPPTDEKNLKELAEKYHLEYDALVENATKYKARPPFIIENAKKRLHTLAQLIGKIVDNAQKEKQIKESEDKLRNVLDSTPFPIAVVDLDDDKIFFWSKSALNLFGHTASTTPEWYKIAYPDPDYRNQVIERWKPYLETARKSGKTVYTGEYNVTSKDGSVRICELYATFHLNNLIVTFNDITEKKQAEEELFQSLEREQTMADIVRNSPVAIAFGYPDGSLDICNKAFSDLTGYTEAELKEINWNEVLTPSKWNEIESEELKKLNPENNIVHYEKEYIHKNGSIIPIELVVTAKFDSENNLIHFIGFVSDITELKKHREHLEELVRERTEDLEKKNKELDAAMKVFVGRELTIRDLQNKIKALGGKI